MTKNREWKEVKEMPSVPPRDAEAHKGSFGRVLIVGGTLGMTGAAILAGRAALRGGAGLVTLALPRAAGPAATAGCPEATQVLLPDAADDARQILEEALGETGAARYQAVAVGPGLGLHPQARALLTAVLSHYNGPHVLDADALNLIACGAAPWPAPARHRVWTPHPGEFQRLSANGASHARPRSASERIMAAEQFVAAHGGVLVLKGHATVVAQAIEHKYEYYVNRTGNPGMATGGAGDVLSGLIAAWLAQGWEPFAAARLGVYLHGLAGDLARDALGEVSLIAGDLVDFLPRAIQQYIQQPLSKQKPSRS